MIMKNLAISIKNVSLLSGLSLVALNTLAVSSASAIGLINPSFELDSVQTLQGLSAYSAGPPPSGNVFSGNGNPGFVIVTQQNNYSGSTANITGWKTTEADTGIELWQSGFQGVSAAPGNGSQFAEVNANTAATLYQDLLISASGGATELSFDFWHRARANGASVQVNAIRVEIIDDAGTGAVLFNKVFATQLDPASINTTDKGWAHYTSANVLAGLSLGSILAPASPTDRSVRFQFQAISLSNATADVYTTTLTAGNVTTYNAPNITTTNTSNLSYGNFLDNANLQTVPFDFSPNLGIGILGGLYLGNRLLKSLKNKRSSES